MTSCPQNKRFAKKGLSVRPLEVTKQVLVDDTHRFEDDFLRLYFENAGGSVENVVLNKAEQSATITFEDHKGRAFTVHSTFYFDMRYLFI